MFVKPSDTPDKKAWDNYTFFDNGRYYAAFGTGVKSQNNPTAHAMGIDIAVSDDGVHWDFIARDILSIQGAHAGFGFKRIGEYIYFYPTCSNKEKGVHFKIYRSKDLIEWEHLGDEYDIAPDRKWYHERWDEMIILEDVEDDKKVYYGYISSETRDDVGDPGCGVLKTYDGENWEILPPVKIDWGEIPSHHMEVNFVEKIQGKYYLSMSGRFYLDSFGYSLYTFVGDSPTGPFKPDVPMFRMTGTSRRNVTWLGHTIDTPDGFLVALWLSCDKRPEIPSHSFSIGALKRLICKDEHLRLGYWEGNEVAKGMKIPLDLTKAQLVHPSENMKSERDNYKTDGSNIRISSGRDGAIIMLPAEFDRKSGFIIEGKIIVKESRHHSACHHHAAAAGFYFEGGNNSGVATIIETLGVTRTGMLSYADHKITDYNICNNEWIELVEGRSGILLGTLKFVEEDRVGPFGHASFCGIRHGKEHSFRIIARWDFYELYIDDLYVQTYILPENMTGKVGIMSFDGTVEYREIKVWQMNF